MSKRTLAPSPRPVPNAAHMRSAAAAMLLAANPPRRVHKPKHSPLEDYERPVNGRRVTLSPQSSVGRTTNEYLGDGFAVSGQGRASRPNRNTPKHY